MIKSWPKPTLSKWSTWVKTLEPLFGNLWVALCFDTFFELMTTNIPFCPNVLHIDAGFYSIKTNIFIFAQGPMLVTLRDVAAITELPTIGCDVNNKLGELETSQTPTLNETPSSFTWLFGNTSTNKKLSLGEEHKYFMWCLLGQFISIPSSAKPKMD